MSPVGKFQQGLNLLPIFWATLIKKVKMGESLNDSPMVGVSGFEPEASWTRTKRDTKLRHTPLALLLYGETCLLSSENVMDYLRHSIAGLPCQLGGCTLLPMVAELRQRIHSKG